MHNFDILIVGAGLTGLSLAKTLANSGLKIGLIDKIDPTKNNSSTAPGQFSLRINAYNRFSEQILRKLKVWHKIPSDRVYSFKNVKVYGKEQKNSVDFSASDIGEPHLGSFIENDLVVKILAESLQSYPNIKLFSSLECHDLQVDDYGAQIITKDSNNDLQKFNTSLIIAADGANSKVRDLAKIDYTTKSYAQHCIVGSIKFSQNHENTAWQKFLNTGPLGLLPLSNNYCSLAWSCTDNEAQRLLNLDTKEFISALEKNLSGYLGEILEVGKLASYPLISRHAKSYYTSRVVLVGDSAHNIHPLAGLGANLGFADAWEISQLILKASSSNQSFFSQDILRQYQFKRWPENSAILNSMTAFNYIHSLDYKISTKLEESSLKYANKLSIFKNLLAKKAAHLGSFTPLHFL